MSLRVGVYDFFAYTLPGALYLAVIVRLLVVLDVVAIDLQSVDLSIPDVIVLAGLSYVAGLVFDPLPNRVWYRFFRPPDVASIRLDRFKQKHPCLKVKFEANEWPILLQRIKRESVDVALDIEKFNAMSKMLKNVSFGLLVLGVIEVVTALRGGWPSLVLAIVFLGLSVAAGKESSKFNSWFYTATYETTIASGLEARDLFERKVESVAGLGDDESCAERGEGDG